jgi:hypothetical protein
VYRFQLKPNILRRQLNDNNNHPINQSGFYCQDKFFSPGLQFQADLGPPQADLPAAGFLKVGFNRIFRRKADKVICRAEATGPKADHLRWAMRTHHRG